MRLVHDGFYKHEVHETPHGSREIVRCPAAICALIYVTDQNLVILVKQKRLAMVSPENPEGWITELVAGLKDRPEPVISILCAELAEEAGVSLDNRADVQQVSARPLALAAGLTNCLVYLYSVSVRSAQLESADRIYGVDEGEAITRVIMTVDEFREYEPEDLRVFALQQWFFRQRQKEEL